MPRLDGLKEYIGIIKFWLGVAVALFTAISNWVINNYDTDRAWLFASAIFALVILMIGIILLNRAMFKKAKEINDIKKGK